MRMTYVVGKLPFPVRVLALGGFGALGMAVGDERLGDVAGHPFLVGEAVADGVDHTGDAAEAVQAAARQVGRVDVVFGGTPTRRDRARPGA